MTSSSEELESDGERLRLQEAVSGIPVKSRQGPSTKKRTSKRATTAPDDEDSSKLVSSDMQTFLAKKLSEHLDSVYKLVSPSHITCEDAPEPEASPSCSTKQQTFGVRLFHDSHHPVTHCPTATINVKEEESRSKLYKHGSKRKRKKPPSDSESSESESEVARLREAAIDSSTIYSNQQHSY